MTDGQGRGDDRRASPVIVAAAISTIAVVFPGLAAGALAVQASDDFGVTEGRYGWTIGVFFLAAAMTSVFGGRVVQHVGPRRQLIVGLLAAAGAQLAVAVVVPSFTWMLVVLAIAGVVNSAVQTAVNLALSQADLPRLGLALAAKQSAMPASAMLGGLAVPALALTLGWRWAYGMGALVALIACLLVARFIESRPRAPVQDTGVVESGSRVLFAAAIVSMMFAFSSGAINAWTVSSGVDAGLSEGLAGVMLSVAAGLGIVFRLISGTRVDRSPIPAFRAAGMVSVVGIVGFALLATRIAPIHAFATVLAFAGGWIWPVFTNFAIVNANPRSAGAATGVTQTGVYIGVFSAPVITGQIIEVYGYPAMWLTVAITGAAAAVLSVALSPSFPR